MVATSWLLAFHIAGKDLYIYFNGRVEGAGHTGFQRNHISQRNRVLKGNMVDGSRYHMRFAVFSGTNSADDVHPAHEVSSHQVAHRVGVVGHDQFGHDRAAVGYFFGR